MARIQKKKLKVDASPTTDTWEWYMRAAESDVAGWMASIDAGQESAFEISDLPEAEIPVVEGDFDFAVVQMDAAGNRSDPASFAGWQAVPLDTSPPPAATGGTIEDVA